MPWLYTNPELLNSIKVLKRDFFNRLKLEDKKGAGAGAGEGKVCCLNYITLYQDCIEQTNNDTQICMPYYKLFLECKDRHNEKV